MFKSGEFVSNWIAPKDGGKLDDKQVQPNGVDLTVDTIFRLDGYSVLGDDEYSKNERTELTPEAANRAPNDEPMFDKPHYRLFKGPHVVRYNEIIEIPEDHVGFVYPRSRLMRCGNHLTSAVWDSGYRGRGEGGLMISNLTFIEEDMRIGQMVMCRASNYQEYEGQHDGENL